MGRLWLILRLSIFVVFIAACSKKYEAEPPSEEYCSVGIDSLSNKISYLTAPIEINISNIENEINDNFSGLIYADSSFDGDDLKFKIWKNLSPDVYFPTVSLAKSRWLLIS